MIELYLTATGQGGRINRITRLKKFLLSIIDFKNLKVFKTFLKITIFYS